MPRFRYTAVDTENREETGELNAASADDARRQLEQRGMTPRSVDVAAAADSVERNAAIGHLGSVAGQIADITDSSLPLAAGLRALSDEMPSRRLRRGFRLMSRRLETGESLQSVLETQKRLIPSELHGVIDAGLKAGKLGAFLEQYLKHARDVRELNRQVWLGLVYPIVLLVAGAAVSIAVPRWIFPQIVPLFDAFGMELPAATVTLIALSDLLLLIHVEMVLGLVLIGIVCWLVIKAAAGRARMRRMFCAIPLFGARSRYLSLSRFCHCLGLLIECGVPLPVALQMAGESTNDANVREGSALLAKKVEQGNPIDTSAAMILPNSPRGLEHRRGDEGQNGPTSSSESGDGTGRTRQENGREPTQSSSSASRAPGERPPHFPADLLHVFRWSDRQEAFPTALHAAGDLYAARACTQTGLIGVLIEPLVVIGVTLSVGWTVLATFMPLIKLLNDLS